MKKSNNKERIKRLVKHILANATNRDNDFFRFIEFVDNEGLYYEILNYTSILKGSSICFTQPTAENQDAKI